MFLATTANHNYWDKNEKILFLGEWCRVYSQKHIWSKTNHEILPSPWENTGELEKRFFYLQSIREKCLKALASKLNEIHGENHPLRYWRIILEPWLICFIGVVYDRYLSIRQAIDSNLVSNTWLPPLNQGNWVPVDFDNFVQWTTEDNFNLYLYGRIIIQLGQISYTIKEFPSYSQLPAHNFYRELNTKLINVIKKILEKVSKISLASNNKIIVCSIRTKLWDLIKLQFNLGQFPYLRAPKVVPKNFFSNEAMRRTLKAFWGINEFENLLGDLIAEHMPSAYLEGFRDLNNRAINEFPKKPKVILTGHCWFDDAFKIWVAHQTAKEAKLILSQIGGGFGTDGFNLSEPYLHEVCDQYFTWGWTEKNKTKFIPMSSAVVGRYIKNTKPDPKGDILLVLNTCPRYFYSFDHVVNNIQIPINLAEQGSFLKNISSDVFKFLLVRLFHYNFGWDEEMQLADNFPNLKIYKGLKTLGGQLKKCRLVVHFFHTTSFLETISINFPTVLYFDPNRLPIRPSAKPYYDELRKVKILHDSPEVAANWINEIHKNPLLWWMSSETQEVRTRFCNQFARTSSSFYKEWAKELFKVTKV